MKREFMTCRNCDFVALVKEDRECRRAIPDIEMGFPLVTPDSWCGVGCWREWSDQYQAWIPYSWGQWEQVSPTGASRPLRPVAILGKEGNA